nr:MAG TPA: hypothetical protein [Caudoviricetes sp.]
MYKLASLYGRASPCGVQLLHLWTRSCSVPVKQHWLRVQSTSLDCSVNQPTLVERAINKGRVRSRKRWGSRSKLTFLGQVGSASRANVNEKGGGREAS